MKNKEEPHRNKDRRRIKKTKERTIKSKKMSRRKNNGLDKAITAVIVVIIILGLRYFNSIQDSNKISDNNNINKEVSDGSNINNKVSNYSSLIDIPDYSGEIYVEVNNNIPYFNEQDYTTEVFEKYSDLDDLGRCGVAYANICKETMPSDGDERGDISSVKPTGWIQKKYDGEYLYNRCHLIGYQLSDEDDNELNLITGTRYFNVSGMLPFENKVAEYIKENGSAHVLYRVTPIFKENNLLASGVEMEGYSVEDNGKGVCFNVYVYNVHPNINIDYSTGESQKVKK